MKKTKLFLAGMAAMTLLAGCGTGKSQNVDVEALEKSLLNDIVYEDTLSKLSDEDISNYIDIPEGVTGVMYMGSGATAESVAIFTAPDKATADILEDNIEMYLRDQESAFEDYKPEEAKRIDNAVLEQEGKYVVLCVSGDSSKAEALIDKTFGE